MRTPNFWKFGSAILVSAVVLPLSIVAENAGTVFFANSSLSLITNSTTSLPVTSEESVKASLYWAPVGSSAFTQIGSAVRVGAIKPGLVLAGPVSTGPLTPGGSPAQFRVRAWFGTSATYEQALAAGDGLVGQSPILVMPTGNPQGAPPLPPRSLGANGLEGFSIVAPPVFVSQPQSRTNPPGSTATFSATVSGAAPLDFIWQKNGTNLTDGGNVAGATTQDLTLSSLTAADAGSYQLVVSNAAGTVNSAMAVLTILSADTTPPAVISLPASPTLHAGSSCTAEMPDLRSGFVVSDPSPPITLSQTPASGTVLPLGLTNVTLSATDAYNNTTSAVVVVNVVDQTPPIITRCAPNQTLVITTGSPASMPNLSGLLQAYDNCSGANLLVTQSPPAGSSLLPGSWNFELVCRDAAGNSNSCSGAIVVSDQSPPVIVQMPLSSTNVCGSNVTFTVSANQTALNSNSSGLLYQWFSVLGPVADATNNSLVVSAGAATASSYWVVVSNTYQSVTSAPVTLTLTDAALPEITAQPQSVTNLLLTRAVFEVTAESCTSPVYQWYFNGDSLRDATNRILEIYLDSISKLGSYQVSVANSQGSITSSPALLTVPLPAQVSPPVVTLVSSDPGSGILTVSIDAAVNPNGLPTETWYELSRGGGFTSRLGGFPIPPVNTNTPFPLFSTALAPGVVYQLRTAASNSVDVAFSAPVTYIAPPLYAAGDFNGDGLVSQVEVDQVLSNYWPTSPWLLMTNTVGLGTATVSFALTNSLDGAFNVEYSTNLLDWLFLGPAVPRYEYVDPEATSSPQRYYRLRVP